MKSYLQVLVLLMLVKCATSQPAVNACNGKSEYDDCSFEKQRRALSGVCISVRGDFDTIH